MLTDTGEMISLHTFRVEKNIIKFATRHYMVSSLVTYYNQKCSNGKAIKRCGSISCHRHIDGGHASSFLGVVVVVVLAQAFIFGDIVLYLTT